jgi:hypothetical protein
VTLQPLIVSRRESYDDTTSKSFWYSGNDSQAGMATRRLYGKNTGGLERANEGANSNQARHCIQAKAMPHLVIRASRGADGGVAIHLVHATLGYPTEKLMSPEVAGGIGSNAGCASCESLSSSCSDRVPMTGRENRPFRSEALCLVCCLR